MKMLTDIAKSRSPMVRREADIKARSGRPERVYRRTEKAIANTVNKSIPHRLKYWGCCKLLKAVKACNSC
jgi:predicted ArsR family transcriptional regulator